MRATLALALLAALVALPAAHLAAAQPVQPDPLSAPEGTSRVCYNDRSPAADGSRFGGGGSRFVASLSGAANIAPNTTGVPLPVTGPSRGTFRLTVDERGQRGAWVLQLCDTPQYIASHLHTGSPRADFAPPLVPLEPYVKPENPSVPAPLLPQLCPLLDVKGCTYTARGSLKSSDIAPLLGREPAGDTEAPSVTDWPSFLHALRAGNIYVNVHSKAAPAGLMRGNLARDAPEGGPGGSGGSDGTAGSGGSDGSAGNAGSDGSAGSDSSDESGSGATSAHASAAASASGRRLK